ncbi:M48 family metallopeptidase [Devosia enhydra]|nr:SprT family zinc-dependent metalloprotease [Devosia enhydra]
MIFSKKRPQRWPETASLEIGGRPVAVSVRVSSRARSYRLSLPHVGPPVLTVPATGRWPDAEGFLIRQTGWLALRMGRRAEPVGFADGAVIPLRGVPHRIVATGKLRGVVTPNDAEGERQLLVPGAPEHMARRLCDWLKVQAAQDLEARCAVHAATLGVTVKAIAMRSQATRWGSCSSTGRLNFNWRLVMAPPDVLDYVAAHEVAHLVEMNHSPAFWRACKRAMPGMDEGRTWLKANGTVLMGYGAEG